VTHPDIVVVGGSAGGIDAAKSLVAGLPSDLAATVFVVIHISPQSPGYLANIFDDAGPLQARNAREGERFRKGMIYVAPPDRHLLVSASGRIETPRGPKENRVRPAVDPLFRSAALEFGERVIGIVLSGGLDDGTAGLRSIKMCGGITVVQEPADSTVESMPLSALRNVGVDYCLPAADMAALVTQLVSTERGSATSASTTMTKMLQYEVNVSRDMGQPEEMTEFGSPSLFTCPECHGTLMSIRGERPARYRCHTGHAFSLDALLAELTESTEQAIWNGIRAVQESAILLSHLADHWRGSDPQKARAFEQQSELAKTRADMLRQAAATQEQLSAAKIAAAVQPTAD